MLFFVEILALAAPFIYATKNGWTATISMLVKLPATLFGI